MGKYKVTRRALFESPWLIPILIKGGGYDNKLTRQILSSYLPYSLGIEIECARALDRKLGVRQMDMMGIYRIHSYSNDVDSYDVGMVEHRIRIDGYKQVHGLWRILEDMKKHCLINKTGGIHIHVDLGGLPVLAVRCALKDYLYSKLDFINGFFNYEGSYNKRGVAINGKGSWVNIRTDLKTVEFRTGYCTFDYLTIIRWCVMCSRLITEFKRDYLKKGNKEGKALY